MKNQVSKHEKRKDLIPEGTSSNEKNQLGKNVKKKAAPLPFFHPFPPFPISHSNYITSYTILPHSDIKF